MIELAHPDQPPLHYVIAYGNVADGHTFVGPFDSHQAAHEYADVDNPCNADWHIILLQHPAQ